MSTAPVAASLCIVRAGMACVFSRSGASKTISCGAKRSLITARSTFAVHHDQDRAADVILALTEVIPWTSSSQSAAQLGVG
jgi:hypothetical protein